MRRKIWLGVGLVAMSGAAGAGAAGVTPGALPAVPAHTAAAKQVWPIADTKAAGGEGGESGAPVAGAVSPVQFYRDIGLIRGHFRVGDELIKLGRWDDAVPHFLHPIEEVYARIAPSLDTYKAAPFDASLKVLLQTVKAKDAGAYAAALATVNKQLLAVDDAMRAKAADWDGFAVRAAVAMLTSASEDYAGAFDAADKSKIKNPVEYQDSRGFVWQAEQMLEASSAKLQAKSAAAYAAVRKAIVELKAAWPDPMPPDKAVMPPDAVLGLIARIELKAGKLMQ